MAAITPRPLRSAAPLVVLAAAALAFDADPRLPWIAGAAGAALFGSAAAVRAVQAALELRRLRATADRLILVAPEERYELVAWRSRELTGSRTRSQLSHEVERTLRSLSTARLPSASPLNRPAARRNVELFDLLIERLDDERPVRARGMLVARQLLRDASSPLYSDRADELLPRALTRVLAELEP
jgi:hypothetical protein